MTRYTVVWHSAARDLLAEIWLTSSLQNEVSEAADFIDRELSTNATEQGQPIGVRFRRFVAPPLEVFFDIQQQDRLVRIVHLRRVDLSQFGSPQGSGNGSNPN